MIEGFRDHSDLPWLLAGADVLVLPNTAKDENSKFFTSPLKLFEYMAASRPIVASSLPSLREILNEKNAVFFEPDNPKSLASAVESLLDNDSLSIRLADNARSDVRGYTWDERAKKIITFLKK